MNFGILFSRRLMVSHGGIYFCLFLLVWVGYWDMYTKSTRTF